MLSRRQKLNLVLLARRAWDASAKGIGAIGNSSAAFDEWRHQEVTRACGKVGLRCCENDDYPRVKAHFLHLLGEDGAAMEWHLRAATEPRRQAEAVLWRELRAAGLQPAYVEAICRTQFKCGVIEAGVKQLWSLVYTVRNRGRQKRISQKATEGTKRTEKAGRA